MINKIILSDIVGYCPRLSLRKALLLNKTFAPVQDESFSCWADCDFCSFGCSVNAFTTLLGEADCTIVRNVKPKHSAPRRIQPLRGWNSVNPSSAKPQTAVANAPLVWGYGKLCLAEALTLNHKIIFNRTAWKILQPISIVSAIWEIA